MAKGLFDDHLDFLQESELLLVFDLKRPWISFIISFLFNKNELKFKIIDFIDFYKTNLFDTNNSLKLALDYLFK